MLTGWRYRGMGNSGFTMIELVLAILLLSILSVAVVEKWPTGLDTEAAALEFTRAVRYAQHMAMTRETKVGNPWGLLVDSGTSRYTVQRQDGVEMASDFTNRNLLEDATMTITGGPVTGLWFNGLGEPVDAAGAPLAAAVTYVIAGVESMTVCPQTGFLLRGATCP